MGNTVLQPKELLGVLLLKTTASRNKMLRMKWSYEGECFKIIEYGHDIYHLSPTNPNAPYDIIVRRNSWPDFLYASVHKKNSLRRVYFCVPGYSCQDTPFGLARNISSDLRCDGEDARKYRVIRQQKILSPIEKMKLAK